MFKRLATILSLLLILSSAKPVIAQATEGPSYIVQPGDTLSSIAERFNVSLEDLMTANEISNPNLLSAGQQLIIPGLEGISGVLLTEVVQFGDSYRSLSRRTQVPSELLRKLNHLVSPSELYVGVSLIVPEQQNATRYSSRVTPGKGETLLELAVKQNSTPWELAQLNGLQGTWGALPGDVLYSPGETSDPTATGLPAVFTQATVSELPLTQGGTAVVRVQIPQDVRVSGYLADRPLRFFSDQAGSQVALQGIHALQDPGPYPLRLEATLQDGSVQSFEQMVLIVSGNYQREDLYVESNTIDPLVTEPENDLVLSLTEAANPDKYWNGSFTSPAVYPDCFTSRYGTRRTYYGLNTDTEIQGFHTGLDFCGGEGLPITAPAAGKVVFAGPVTVRGNATIIDHGWGIYSGFWHQSGILVKQGEMVEQGQVIGLVGGTGRVTGAHLHWEILVNGVQANPMDWLTNIYP
jgi:murein DD-endopeptidase MepM/ murein hydrolase activator NlpD